MAVAKVGTGCCVDNSNKDVNREEIVRGCFTTQSGEPLTNKLITVFEQSFASNTLRLIAKSHTDTDGNFSLGPLESLSEKDIGRREYVVFAPANTHGPSWKIIKADTDFRQIKNIKLVANETIELKGKVITKENKPISGALIWIKQIIPNNAGKTSDPLLTIAPLSGWYTTSDETGNFIINDAPNNVSIGIEVSHPNFATSVVNANSSSPLDIVLDPAAVINGQVLYGGTKQPASNVTVQAQRIDRSYSYFAETETDLKGKYQLKSLPAGKYNIWAKEEDFTVNAIDSFEVKGGETYEVSSLNLIKGGFIKGKIIDANIDKPIRPGYGADVAIYGPSRPKSGVAVESSLIEPDGSFKIRVAPGRNYIYLRPGKDYRQQVISPPYHWVEIKDGETAKVIFKVQEPSDK